MKKIILSISICGAVIASLLSCEKNDNRIIATTPSSDSVMLKINYAMPFALNPGVQISVNGNRLSNIITYCTPFPGGGLNTGGSSNPDYLALNPGTLQVSIATPKVNTNIDSVTRYSGSVTLAAGKQFTMHITDTAANATYVMTEDYTAMPDSGKAVFRFVNLIPNVPAIDLYFGTQPVKTNIAYKAITDTFHLQAASTQQWRIRPAGAAPTTTPIAVYPAGTGTYTILNQRCMTVFSRGYGSATGTRAPAISLLFNR